MAFLYLCHTYNYKPENKFLWCTTNALCTRIFTPHPTACFCRVISHYVWDNPTFLDLVLGWWFGVQYDNNSNLQTPTPNPKKGRSSDLYYEKTPCRKTCTPIWPWSLHLPQWSNGLALLMPEHYSRSLNFPPSPHLYVPKNRWSVFG